MTRAELKAMAKEQIKGNIITLFLITIVIAVIGGLCGGVPVVGWIAALIVIPSFSLSLCNIYLMLTKKEEIGIGDVFSKFDQAGRACWLYILTKIFTFLWSLLFVIPGIVKQYSYSMAFYILADHPELTAREALRKSIEMMKGHKFELFVLQLSFILWHMLGAITFGLAYIYVTPYMCATVANFYNSIKGE